MRRVTMVMWQILIGCMLEAWNNQLLGPARGSAVHAFLLKKERDCPVKDIQWDLNVRHFGKEWDNIIFSPSSEGQALLCLLSRKHQASSSETTHPVTLWHRPFPFSLSPFLPFSLSPFLPFSLSPFLPFSLLSLSDTRTFIHTCCLKLSGTH